MRLPSVPMTRNNILYKGL